MESIDQLLISAGRLGDDMNESENDFILDGKIWISVIISLIMTLLVMSWTYYS